MNSIGLPLNPGLLGLVYMHYDFPPIGEMKYFPITLSGYKIFTMIHFAILRILTDMQSLNFMKINGFYLFNTCI